jgi:retron-type reverse transcriptase
VVDADLADYFGSIPHADLLKSVARRIVDRRVLHLVRMWLDCPVEETELLSLTNGRMFPLSVQDGKSGVNGPVDIVGVR